MPFLRTPFQGDTRIAPRIAGVRPWLHGLRLTSLGVKELDTSIGGGVTLHSLVLIKEDAPSSTYRSFVDSFIDEGNRHQHKIIVCSNDNHLRQTPDDNASRYVKIDSLSTSTHTSINNTPQTFYKDLSHRIHTEAEDLRLDETNVTRLVVHSLASPAWSTPPSTHDIREIFRFLLCLRHLVRSKPMVAMVTIPSFVFEDFGSDCFDSIFDVVFALHTLSDSGKAKYGDYGALIELQRLTPINSLSAHRPTDRQLLVKVGKRKLKLEALSLPPEHSRVGDSNSRVIPASSGMSCSGGAELPSTMAF